MSQASLNDTIPWENPTAESEMNIRLNELSSRQLEHERATREVIEDAVAVTELLREEQRAAVASNNNRPTYRPPTVIKVKPPVPYSGEIAQDVNDWVSQFIRFAELQGWKESQYCQALPFYLTGQAYTWYASLDSPTSSWAELSRALCKYFDSAGRRWQNEEALASTRQYPGQPLDEYVERVKSLSRRVQASDMEMRKTFVRGLLPAVKTHVLMHDPQTFYDAERLARMADSAQSHTGVAAFSVASGSARLDQMEDKMTALVSLESSVAKLTSAVAEAGLQGPRDGYPVAAMAAPRNRPSGNYNRTGQDSGDLVCFSCQFPGHMQRQCHLACQLCHKLGHVASQCRKPIDQTKN